MFCDFLHNVYEVQLGDISPFLHKHVALCIFATHVAVCGHTPMN